MSSKEQASPKQSDRQVLSIAELTKEQAEELLRDLEASRPAEESCEFNHELEGWTPDGGNA